VAEQDDPADSAARLEEALERIARLARASREGAGAGDAPGPDIAEISARLDALISQLRAALGPTGGG
jgi:hypothetical protein